MKVLNIMQSYPKQGNKYNSQKILLKPFSRMYMCNHKKNNFLEIMDASGFS